MQHNLLQYGKIIEIHKRFNQLKQEVDAMEDGILDFGLYETSPVRILWVLKQDFYDSGAQEIPYDLRLRESLQKKALSPSWRRMGYVTYGLLNGLPKFADLPFAEECASTLLQTAVIEVDKELGNSSSPDDVILDGFNRYKGIVEEQIRAFDPDIIIVGMTGAHECLRIVPETIFHMYNPGCDYETKGDLCERTAMGHKSLLWVCHPAVTKYGDLGISDELYYESIMVKMRKA